MIDLRQRIAEFPDFPVPGILFRDLLPLLADPTVFAEIIERFRIFAEPLAPDVVLAAEARGFLFGPTLAHVLGCSFAPARKPGKLPGQAWKESYALEYGENSLELSKAALQAGMRVLIHDDLLATGGTAAASIALARQAAAVPVGACFVAELQGLQGRTRLAGLPTISLVEYEGA